MSETIRHPEEVQDRIDRIEDILDRSSSDELLESMTKMEMYRNVQQYLRWVLEGEYPVDDKPESVFATKPKGEKTE